MGTFIKTAVYSTRRFSRVIQSTGGTGWTSIFQAPSNGISRVSGFIYHATNNRDDYSFSITSTNSGTPRQASGSRVFYPNSSAVYVIAAGTGAGVSAIYTMDASVDNGILLTRGQGYLFFRDYPIPTSHYMGWELSGGVGAANTGYDLYVTDVTYA